MEETVGQFKASCLWKVVIVFVEVLLASLIIFSIPASPNFSVVFASATTHHHHRIHLAASSSTLSRRDLDLDLGFSITNFAIDGMVYNQITATAFHGEDHLATAELMPFEQRGGEQTAVWFTLENVTLPQTVIDDMSFGDVAYVRIELRAKTTYMGGIRPKKKTHEGSVRGYKGCFGLLSDTSFQWCGGVDQVRRRQHMESPGAMAVRGVFVVPVFTIYLGFVL